MKGALKGAAFGALVASAAALLLAPTSGKKTRADLVKLLHVTSQDLQKKAKRIHHLSKAQYEQLFLNSLTHTAKKKEEIAELIADVSSVLRKGWDDVRQELKQTAGQKRAKGKK